MHWLALCLALVPLKSGDLRGVYHPDLSRAPAKDRGVLQAIFCEDLQLHRDGTFSLVPPLLAGFWRRDGGRAVLVVGSFMGRAYAVPDDVLKRSWPDSQLSGMVLKVRPDGTLILDRFGGAGGPVIFRRAPRIDTLTLLQRSDGDDEMGAESAFQILVDELPEREGELVRIVEDPHRPFKVRQWATYFFGHGLSPAGVAAASRIVDGLDTRGLDSRKTKILRSSLSHNLSEIATNDTVEALLRVQREWKISESTLAKAMEHAGYRKGIPALVGWLAASSEYARSYSASALASLGAKEALPALRKLAEDPQAVAKIGALAAILRLSDDAGERERSIHALGGLVGKADFGNPDIYRALGGSGSRSALPYLAAGLFDGPDYDCEAAARGLGELGFAECVPALLEAKKHPGDLPPISKANLGSPELASALGRMMDYSRVKKAVVEALYRIDRRKAPVPHADG